MREILFRGKRKDTGEWIDGNIVKLGKESFSDPERYGICNKAIPIGGLGICYNLRIYEVIPETIGQYIGLKDNDKKSIFEGDFIQSCENNDVFLIKYFDSDNYPTFDCTPENSFCDGFKIIGNIYDNPAISAATEDTRSRIYNDFMKSCKS